jgi:hypothetical protein
MYADVLIHLDAPAEVRYRNRDFNPAWIAAHQFEARGKMLLRQENSHEVFLLEKGENVHLAMIREVIYQRNTNPQICQLDVHVGIPWVLAQAIHNKSSTL